MEEFDVNKMEVDDGNVSVDLAEPQQNESLKRKDPTEAELKEYFQQVDQKVKSLNIKNGAKEFSYDDGFSCVARDEKNANRKHQNWINDQVWLKSK